MQLCPLPYTTHLHQHPLLRHQALPLALCCRRSLEHGQDGVGVAQQAQHAAQQRAQRLAAAVGGVLWSRGRGGMAGAGKLRTAATSSWQHCQQKHCRQHAGTALQGWQRNIQQDLQACALLSDPVAATQDGTCKRVPCCLPLPTHPVALQDVHHSGIDAVKIR